MFQNFVSKLEYKVFR